MDYHVKPLGKTCAATGKPLVPGSVCHSILVERDGSLVRLDFSEEGWTGPPPNHLGYWTVDVPPAADPRKTRINPEAALRYVLALILLQLRKLKLENVRFDDDDEVLELSGVHGEGQFEVRNYHLDDAETQKLQAELKLQLAMEWQT